MMAKRFKAADQDFTKHWDHSDVAFVTDDGQKVYASKTILAMWSPVMGAMFFQDFREKGSPEIKLPGKNFCDILELMKVLHPPNKVLTDNTVSNMLALAREYQIAGLTKKCEQYLVSRPPSLKNLVLAQEYSLSDLHKACMKYTQSARISQLKSQRAFEMLSTHTKLKILLDKSKKYESILDEVHRIAQGKENTPLHFLLDSDSEDDDKYCKDTIVTSRHVFGTDKNCKSCSLNMVDQIRKEMKKFEKQP